MSNPTKLQFQYHFADPDMHSMDAFVRHQNETEILAIFRDIVHKLELDVQIECEALAEGSLKSVWKFLGKNEKQLKLIGAILAGILITAPLTYWQALNLKIDYEIKQEELRKLKKEAIESDTLPTSKVQKIVRNLQEDYKVGQHLSNIYTTMNEYSEVIQVSTHQLDINNKPIAPEQSVPKSEFKAFLLEPRELDPTIDETAIIEIVSPVLKAGRYVWTGVYHDELISFYMLDEQFKGAVLAKQYSFSNGISIKCVLQRKRTLDKMGIEKITQNNVLIVIQVLDIDASDSITPQATKYFNDKRSGTAQLPLFRDEE